jgi:hypothetical protein
VFQAVILVRAAQVSARNDAVRRRNAVPGQGRSLAINGRTLSRVTRRKEACVELRLDRRVTVDRAVCTKPLACAADAASQLLCVFNKSPSPKRSCLAEGYEG